jgi:hypothetical protein
MSRHHELGDEQQQYYQDKYAANTQRRANCATDIERP